jgi:Virulence factor
VASLTILYWRDIPSQVIVKSGRSAAKRQLSDRFIRAIDAAAMHAGAKSDDAYLAEWRRGEPIPCGDELENEAAAAAELLEKEYDTHRLAILAKHDGRENSA